MSQQLQDSKQNNSLQRLERFVQNLEVMINKFGQRLDSVENDSIKFLMKINSFHNQNQKYLSQLMNKYAKYAQNTYVFQSSFLELKQRVINIQNNNLQSNQNINSGQRNLEKSINLLRQTLMIQSNQRKKQHKQSKQSIEKSISEKIQKQSNESTSRFNDLQFKIKGLNKQMSSHFKQVQSRTETQFKQVNRLISKNSMTIDQKLRYINKGLEKVSSKIKLTEENLLQQLNKQILHSKQLIMSNIESLFKKSEEEILQQYQKLMEIEKYLTEKLNKNQIQTNTNATEIHTLQKQLNVAQYNISTLQKQYSCKNEENQQKFTQIKQKLIQFQLQINDLNNQLSLVENKISDIVKKQVDEIHEENYEMSKTFNKEKLSFSALAHIYSGVDLQTQVKQLQENLKATNKQTYRRLIDIDRFIESFQDQMSRLNESKCSKYSFRELLKLLQILKDILQKMIPDNEKSEMLKSLKFDEQQLKVNVSKIYSTIRLHMQNSDKLKLRKKCQSEDRFNNFHLLLSKGKKKKQKFRLNGQGITLGMDPKNSDIC